MKARRFVRAQLQLLGSIRVIAGRPNLPINVRQDATPAAPINRSRGRQVPVGTTTNGPAQLDWLLRLLNILALLLHLLPCGKSTAVVANMRPPANRSCLAGCAPPVMHAQQFNGLWRSNGHGVSIGRACKSGLGARLFIAL